MSRAPSHAKWLLYRVHANSKKARTFCMSVQALRKYSSAFYMNVIFACGQRRAMCSHHQSLHHLHPLRHDVWVAAMPTVVSIRTYIRRRLTCCDKTHQLVLKDNMRLAGDSESEAVIYTSIILKCYGRFISAILHPIPFDLGS